MSNFHSAHKLRPNQISCPDWIAKDHSTSWHDCRGLGQQGRAAILKALLHDRFKLETHMENSEHPAYALVVAEGGAKMKDSPARPAVAEDAPGMKLGLPSGQALHVARHRCANRRLVSTFRQRVVTAAFVCATCCAAAVAQDASLDSAGRKFEIVSIRQNAARNLIPMAGGVALQVPGAVEYGPTPDGYHTADMPLSVVIQAAYRREAGGGTFAFEDIMGMPDWASSERYDINARISDADRAAWQDPKKRPEMLSEMLQALLAERFQVRAHREQKEKPVYSLVLAKSGPKFQEAKQDEPHPYAAAIPGGGFMGPAPGGILRFYNVTMPTFASQISNFAGRTVKDNTGLTGQYDLSFPYPAPPTAAVDASSTLPSIFSVMEGLGLKLEPAKGEVETLVIDHIEKPSPN